MTEAPTPVEGMTVEQASAERATLMADPAWRAQAMNPASAEWGRMASLNATIAGPDEPEEAPPVPYADADPDPDVEAPEGTYDPPPSAGQYQLPDPRAAGLEADPQVEIECRRAFHAMGLDQSTASLLYSVAIHAAQQDQSAVTVAAEYTKAEGALRQTWGREFEPRLEIARAEARRLFDGLPDSVKQGRTLKEFALDTGLANSKHAVLQLYQRAKARGLPGGS